MIPSFRLLFQWRLWFQANVVNTWRWLNAWGNTLFVGAEIRYFYSLQIFFMKHLQLNNCYNHEQRWKKEVQEQSFGFCLVLFQAEIFLPSIVE